MLVQQRLDQCYTVYRFAMLVSQPESNFAVELNRNLWTPGVALKDSLALNPPEPRKGK